MRLVMVMVLLVVSMWFQGCSTTPVFEATHDQEFLKEFSKTVCHSKEDGCVQKLHETFVARLEVAYPDGSWVDVERRCKADPIICAQNPRNYEVWYRDSHKKNKKIRKSRESAEANERALAELAQFAIVYQVAQPK